MAGLTLITPPEAEPVTVAQVKIHARIDASYDVEDALITSWIKTARLEAEKTQRKAYIDQTWLLSMDFFPWNEFRLPRAPLSSLKSIKYYDFENTEYTLYDIDTPVGTEDEFIVDTKTARISLAYGVSWPTVILRPIDAVHITYIAGYDADGTLTPDEVKDAIYLYCTYRYENRTAEFNKIPKPFYDLLNTSRLYYGKA